ncbi:MAG: M28 family peptidase, partial [Phycisphaeraceae bacterium]
ALAGKVAVAFRYEPTDERGRSRFAGLDGQPGRWSDAASLSRKARWAADHSAAALLVVDPPSLDAAGTLLSTVGTDLGQPAALPVMHLRSGALRRMLEAGGREPDLAWRTYEQRANAGRDRPDPLAGVQLTGEVRLEHPHATIHNVAAYLPGSGALADEVVAIGAHYDHLGFGEIGSFVDPDDLPALHPGADDNASGVAGLMLLAERAAERRHGERGASTADRRALLFAAFSGEERGLLGSMHMVQHPRELALPLDATVAMLNLDMIGRLDDELLVFGSGSADAWDALLEGANAGVGLRLRRASGGIGLSDQTSFYLHRIPVLHFFTGVHDDYHRPTDTADRIHAEGGAAVIALVDELVNRVATMPTRLTFIGDADPHAAMPGHEHRDGAGPGIGRVYLGVLPDYATLEGDGGAGLSAIVPASPAEAAGLAAGDRIVAWNDEPVENVRTLTRLLGAAEPGATVTLTVERDGRRQKLEVELGSR